MDPIEPPFTKAIRSPVRVSRADLEDRYEGIKLSYQAFDPTDGSKVWRGFVPTHRISFRTTTRVLVDYVMLVGPGTNLGALLGDIDATKYVGAATPADFELSTMGIHVVRVPTYLTEPDAERWWRYKVPEPDLAGGTCKVRECEYLPDHPELLDRLRRARAEVAVDGQGVYFIQGSEGGPIKVGFTTDIKGRVAGLQTANPDRLAVIAFLPGATRQVEQSLHAEFAHARLPGGSEWFKERPVVTWLKKNGHLPH